MFQFGVESTILPSSASISSRCQLQEFDSYIVLFIDLCLPYFIAYVLHILKTRELDCLGDKELKDIYYRILHIQKSKNGKKLLH